MYISPETRCYCRHARMLLSGSSPGIRRTIWTCRGSLWSRKPSALRRSGSCGMSSTGSSTRLCGASKPGGGRSSRARLRVLIGSPLRAAWPRGRRLRAHSAPARSSRRSATTCSTATMCGCTASRRCTRSPPQAGSSPGIRYLTCWVALDDATGENGCPWFVPGLFRRGPLLHQFDGSNGGWTISGLRSEDAVCVPVKAGSVAVFWSLTPHMTGANNTDGVSKAYICQYAPDGYDDKNLGQGCQRRARRAHEG